MLVRDLPHERAGIRLGITRNLVPLCHQLMVDNIERVDERNSGHQAGVMSLVIQNLLIVVSLTTDSTIADSNGQGLGEDDLGSSKQSESLRDQGSIREDGVGRRGELAFRRHGSPLHHHVLAGDPDRCELDPAIVESLTSGLVSDIASSDTRLQLSGLAVTEGDDEPVDAVVLSIDDRLADSNY